MESLTLPIEAYLLYPTVEMLTSGKAGTKTYVCSNYSVGLKYIMKYMKVCWLVTWVCLFIYYTLGKLCWNSSQSLRLLQIKLKHFLRRWTFYKDI